MSVLGHIRIKDFLKKTKGAVRGKLITDAKYRVYAQDFKWRMSTDGYLLVSRRDNYGDTVKVKPTIDLDESMVAFFGLYSGDGRKGSESSANPEVIKAIISFSQRELNLVRFAAHQFRRLFGESIRFSFQLGEDSAFFMGGDGLEMLRDYYGGKVPVTPILSKVHPKLNSADERYLQERRNVNGTNKEHLAFYYFHKEAMETILGNIKSKDLEKSGIKLNKEDKVAASLRRPFKKGAREPGGTSRSDEMHVGGLNGFGELFLKILYEIEDSIYLDEKKSTQGLIQWSEKPSGIGELIDIKQFFSSHNYGSIAGKRPEIIEEANFLVGKWSRSRQIQLRRTMRINPLFCYVSGLYLAEGSTPKSKMFSMFGRRPAGLNLSFTSSENTSIELVLRSLQMIFLREDCVNTWKIKVGSQYFPELVVIGLKSGVPMLRGGNSGDGKLRTMEISLSLKPWALQVITSLTPFQSKYSHVEPTGAGLARIDFSASSSLCRWYFPLLVYAAFGSYIKNPVEDFIHD